MVPLFVAGDTLLDIALFLVVKQGGCCVRVGVSRLVLCRGSWIDIAGTLNHNKGQTSAIAPRHLHWIDWSFSSRLSFLSSTSYVESGKEITYKSEEGAKLEADKIPQTTLLSGQLAIDKGAAKILSSFSSNVSLENAAVCRRQDASE